MGLNFLPQGHLNSLQALHCHGVTVLVEDFGDRLEMLFEGLLLVWIHDDVQERITLIVAVVF